jgi:uncharacterized protein (TIGR02996 family)
MNERDALMRAICEHPDEDTPRLVFADWLQEHGDEARAEFIRLEIQLARGQYQPSEEARLKRRVKKLLTTHGPRWQKEIGGFGKAIFRRGFLAHTAIHVDDLERALASAPFDLIELEGEVNLVAILQLPGIARLRYLNLSNATIRGSDLEAFIERDWPTHPWKMRLPESVSPDNQSRISTRFASWIFFGQWW